MPHKTAIQEHFLLDIITSDSLDAFNGITNTTVTKQSRNWYRWGTFLKHTGITNTFLGGVPQEQRKPLCHHSPPQCDETSSAQLGNASFRKGTYTLTENAEKFPKTSESSV